MRAQPTMPITDETFICGRRKRGRASVLARCSLSEGFCARRTMWPARRSSMSGRNARVVQSGPSKLTLTDCVISASVRSTSSLAWATPALLTSIVTGPSWARTRRAVEETADGDETSHWKQLMRSARRRSARAELQSRDATEESAARGRTHWT